MLTLFLLAALSSLSMFPGETPEAALDRDWGELARAPHQRGSWSIQLEDGRAFHGEWVVGMDRGSRGSLQEGIYLAGDVTCVVSGSERLRCRRADPELTHVFDGNLPAPLALTGELAVDVELTRDECPRGSCVKRPAGRLRIQTRPATPTVEETGAIFKTLHGRSVMDHLARWGFEVKLLYSPAATPSFRVVHATATSGTRTVGTDHVARFDRVVTRRETHLRIGPHPTAIAVTRRRELERFVERCETSAHAATSCGYTPPTCTRVVPAR